MHSVKKCGFCSSEIVNLTSHAWHSVYSAHLQWHMKHRFCLRESQLMNRTMCPLTSAILTEYTQLWPLRN